LDFLLKISGNYLTKPWALSYTRKNSPKGLLWL